MKIFQQRAALTLGLLPASAVLFLATPSFSETILVPASREGRLIRDTTADGKGNVVNPPSHLAHVGEFSADSDQGRFYLPFYLDTGMRTEISRAARVMLRVSYGARGNAANVQVNGGRFDLAVDLYGFEGRSSLLPLPEDYENPLVSLLLAGAVTVHTPVERYLAFDVTDFARRQAAGGSVMAFRFQIQQENALPNSDGMVNRHIFHSPDHATNPPYLKIVPAKPRQFHFHHWSLEHSPRHATGGLVRDGQAIDHWRQKGVVAQRWRGGRWAFDHGFDTPEKMAGHWLAHSEWDWPGILIDEITGQEDSRNVMGEALLIAREQSPGLHMAAYVVPYIGGEKLVRGLREAVDLVLVEAYEASARAGYSRIENRWRSAVEHDLVDKSVVALGLFNTWITNPRELGRQLHFLRYHAPEAPGVGFFGHASAELYEYVDMYLGNLFAGPALRAEVDESGRLRVENIGGVKSPPALVRSRLGGEENLWIVTVPPLPSGSSFASVEQRPGAVPLTEYHGEEGYQVIGPPLLWDREWRELRPGAVDPWPFKDREPERSLRVDFSVDPEFEYIANQSGETGYDGNREAACKAIPDTGGDAVEFSVGLSFETVNRYGRISVGLRQSTGESLLNFEIFRGDGEQQAFAIFSARNEEGLFVREDIASPFSAGDSVRLIAAHLPGRFVRARIATEGGTIPWDTGRIPLPGPAARFDLVRFGITAGDGSLLEWDASAGNLILRGQFPNSGYRLQGRAGDFSLRYFKACPVERWKADWFSPLELENPLRTGDGVSFSGDGVPNLVKYLFGLNPRIPGAFGLPGIEEGEGGYAVSFPLADAAEEGVEWSLAVSTDLVTWHEFPAEPVRGKPVNNEVLVSQKIPAEADNGAVFVRLIVRRLIF